MANWAPVYSPQQRNTERKEGQGGPTTSGNHQAKRALDPEIPVSDPTPLLTLSPPCLYSTPPPPFLSICLPPALLSTSLLFFPPTPSSSSPPLVPAAHHFHVSSAVGLIQTDCLTVSKTYSHSEPPLLPLSVLCSSRGTDTLFHSGGGAGVSLAWVSLLHRTISGGMS